MKCPESFIFLMHQCLVKTKKESGCVPTDSGGMIKNSGLPLQLKLKIGARVYLTHNIDVVDGLANGTMGIVIGFKKKNRWESEICYC